MSEQPISSLAEVPGCTCCPAHLPFMDSSVPFVGLALETGSLGIEQLQIRQLAKKDC